MRSSSWLRLSLLAFVIAGSCALAQAQQTITGSYTFYSSDQSVGVETYTVTIDSDGSLKAVADIGTGSAVTHVVTTASKTGPVKFELTVGAQGGITTDFAGGMAKTSGLVEGNVKTTATSVLENGVWHQFLFLLRQYDGARGGAQSFKTFVPSQMLELGLRVERLDTPSFTINGTEIVTEHYRVTSNQGLIIELWTDVDRMPLLISIPIQRVKVIRKGAEGIADKLFGNPAAKQPAEDIGSEEVTFNNGEVKLAGTLTLPRTGKAPYPAAVIISGSGPNDRDGARGGFNIYKLVAEGLTRSGVVVLRFDVRGVGKSVVPDRRKPVSYRDLINDSRAAFEYLAQRPEVDKTRIALVGHSEGAETALTIAGEDPRVAAIVLLGGCARPLDQVVVEQTIYQQALQELTDPTDTGKQLPDARAIIQRFELIRNQKAPPAGDDPDAWFRGHLASDPSGLARRVKCPVLILNGERDPKVLAHNAIDLAQALTAAGNKQVRLRIFLNLNHTFMPASVEANPEKATEVSTEVLRTIETWIAKVLPTKTP